MIDLLSRIPNAQKATSCNEGSINAQAGREQLQVCGQIRSSARRKSIADFQGIIDHRGISPLAQQWVLAHLGLARAQASSGEIAKARSSYQNFFALLADGDPDIPLLKQAKAEYAKLQ